MVGKSAQELSAIQFPSPWKYLGAWLTEGSLSMLHAYRGIGKTLFCLALADAVSRGSPFLGWAAELAIKIIYFDSEMGYSAIARRMARINKAWGKNPNLHFVTFEDCPNGVIWNLADHREHRKFAEIIEGFDLVIFDNLCGLVRQTRRESDVELWANVQSFLIPQRSNNRSFLFVHHSGKSGLQLGTSTREHVLDSVLNLRRPAIEADETSFELHFEKTRHFHGADASPMRVDMRDTSEGLAFQFQPLKAHHKKQVLELHRRGWSNADISKALNIHFGQVREYVREDSTSGGWVEKSESKACDDDLF